MLDHSQVQKSKMGFSSQSGQILVEFTVSAAAFFLLFYTLIHIAEYRMGQDRKNRFSKEKWQMMTENKK